MVDQFVPFYFFSPSVLSHLLAYSERMYRINFMCFGSGSLGSAFPDFGLIIIP
jgi:hypothetical protein